ncbi:ATP-binding protein involved in chromosome partitioning [Rhodothalassium salexigens DSM 2132]|uniref:Iron-sulfur cluster carrier protein n=2 Tax=Rhodothalassium salexigens TaxID=1086 RepID=A0A4R2P7D5_RHOSA|nr:iron-sulfur cluster carrier protein ApbC [Rhodothalassium salexigens]MBB4212600.1 ATP-binding protein involved in chromosome partitioning [Rhodothalassium salexigens DSM 2132]MBK1640148.1 Fe-S-binding ATPase [Rhodothalassium salexigens DSM 2132]TCP30802.1 ATP-binding protein involved in chromosome partitioning [Rhodothalassium salexigens DSM 2132]
MPPTRDTILAALRAVVDPETGRNVVDAGLISGLTLSGGQVGFSLDLGTSGDAAAKEPLRRACEDAVRALDGVDAAFVVLTAERPPSPAPAASRRRSDKKDNRSGAIAGVRHIIAVASGKGGVGKSTLSVNLALGLRDLGLKVGIMDADIYGPSLPRMLGISGEPQSDGKTLTPFEARGVKAMSIGFIVEEDKAMIWRGPMVMTAVTQLLYDVDWAPLDVLVVDMPPGTGDAQLTMAQRVPLSGAVVVSTPQDIALIDARKGIAMFDKVNVPLLGLVENMSYYVCPHCGSRDELFGHGGARATAEARNTPFLGEVPLHLAIREMSDTGTPIVDSQPDSEQAQAFARIAQGVKAQLDARAQAPTGPTIRMG